MFGRKSASNTNRTGGNAKKNLSQFGFMEMPDITNMGGLNDFDNGDDDDDDDDDALEAELLALTGGQSTQKQQKKPEMVNPLILDKMIKDTLRDIPSDEDVSSGEDDPNLMAELEELQEDIPSSKVIPSSTPNTASGSLSQLLEERLQMYETAEQNAKQANDLSKARRMNRGISNIKDLLKQVNAGKKIDEESIPPIVSVQSKPAPTVSPTAVQNMIIDDTPIVEDAVSPPPIPPRVSRKATPEKTAHTDEKDSPTRSSVNVIDLLTTRQEEYKKAAINAKKNGDIETALKYVKIVKNFDTVISEAREGAIIDLASIPPVPESAPVVEQTGAVSVNPASPLKRQSSERQRSSMENKDNVEVQQMQDTPELVSVPQAIPEPKTVMEALQQRLSKFKESEENAKKENNASKVRRMGRIVKQYEDAIRLHKAGKPIPVDELPTPPGFAPIPMNSGNTSAPQPPPKTEAVSPAPVPEKRPPVKSPPTAPTTGGHSAAATSRSVKQLQLVLERQKQFKFAALKAKQAGRMDKAREYLRTAMSFEPMIDTLKNGSPIDLTSLPSAPKEETTAEASYEVVRLNDCIEGTELDVYRRLQTDLQHQVEMSIKMRDHYKAIGDIPNANSLEQLAVKMKKDLKFVQLAENNNLKLPKFHYETKPFTILQCNVDLTDNDVEVEVVQGINYNVPNPKEIDTYVRLYFPYPTETPQQFKTSVVYNTNNPSYNTKTVFNIQRNVRACQRIFKRQNLKCEVWSRGGFLRSDSLIATVNVKLQPLETQCVLHDAYDLMDGRKTIGGKLEVKLRIRDPILQKQVEHVEEKWLIIDS